MQRIKIDRDKCIGCLTCVTACAVKHQSGDSRNRVVIDSETKPAPIFCRHCTEAECVYTCMTGAMHKNPATQFVEYDKNQCASCYMCVMACPFGVLKPDSLHKTEIMKCDMCGDKEEGGGRKEEEVNSSVSSWKPFCVEKCPMHAITFETIDEQIKEGRS